MVTIYNKPGYPERLEAFTISVGDSLTSLSVCASGGSVAGVDVYPVSCGATGRYMRLSVDNQDDKPYNIREVDAVVRSTSFAPSTPSYPVQRSLSSSIASATSDPYDTTAFWWLANCPASDCHDGDISTTASETCGANTTNLCHTGYVDQIHTLTYEFTGSCTWLALERAR